MRDPDVIDALVGRVLGGTYRLDRMLGAGGMGAVFEATHVRTGRRYALKVMLPEVALRRESMARFRREAEAVGALGHANVIAIHDFLEDDGLVYLVMDRLEGEDLAARVERDAPMSIEAALPILRGMAAGLGAAHAAGLVHRDLKPANVFLARQPGAEERPVLLDFGLVKSFTEDVDARLTASGVVMGTPLYMSPEQASGRPLDARADLYALATILYEMLVGRPPFVGPTLPALFARLATEPPPRLARDRPDLPAALSDVLDVALEKAPEQRFASAAAFVRAVEEAVGATTTAAPTPVGNPAQSWPRGAVLGHGADPYGPTQGVPSPLAGSPATRIAAPTPPASAPARGRSALPWIVGLVLLGCALSGGLVSVAVFLGRPEPPPVAAIDEPTAIPPEPLPPIDAWPTSADSDSEFDSESGSASGSDSASVSATTPLSDSLPVGGSVGGGAERDSASGSDSASPRAGAPSSARRARPPAAPSASPAAPLAPAGPSPDDPVARATERSAVGDYAGCVRILRAAPRSARVLGARMACALSANDGADLRATCAELRAHYPQHQYARTCDAVSPP